MQLPWPLYHHVVRSGQYLALGSGLYRFFLFPDFTEVIVEVDVTVTVEMDVAVAVDVDVDVAGQLFGG